MVLGDQEMVSDGCEVISGDQELTLDHQEMVSVDQEVVLGTRRRFWVAKWGPSCLWCSSTWSVPMWPCCRTCHRDLGTQGWGFTGSLGDDVTCVLAAGIPVGGHHGCPHPELWDAVLSHVGH